MHLVTRDGCPAGLSVLIMCLQKQEERMQKTCFRGRGLKLAGNFMLWASVEDVMRGRVRNDLVDDVLELWQLRDFGTHSLSFEMPHHIGWESTAPKKIYRPEELEGFRLNNHTTAERIRLDNYDRLAPLTRELTIIYRLEDQRGEPKVTIYSMYPGIDIGELDGDITAREGRVFFDWNHPGE